MSLNFTSVAARSEIVAICLIISFEASYLSSWQLYSTSDSISFRTLRVCPADLLYISLSPKTQRLPSLSAAS